MLLNLSKDGGILIKDGFSVSHSLGHGSLFSSKGLGCNREDADCFSNISEGTRHHLYQFSTIQSRNCTSFIFFGLLTL